MFKWNWKLEHLKPGIIISHDITEAKSLVGFQADQDIYIYTMTMSRVAVNRIKNKLSILNLHANWWGQEGISPLGELHHCSLFVLFHLMKHLVPITGGMILKQMDQRYDLLWQCLAYPAWGGSCWKGLRSIFIFSGFSEATCTAAYVCFSSFYW